MRNDCRIELAVLPCATDRRGVDGPLILATRGTYRAGRPCIRQPALWARRDESTERYVDSVAVNEVASFRLAMEPAAEPSGSLAGDDLRRCHCCGVSSWP